MVPYHWVMEPRTLRDDDLLLRPVQADDAPAIFDACQDPELARFIPHFPTPYTEEDARSFSARCVERWREDVAYPFVIAEASSGELLGTIESRAPREGVADVGYWVKREARGRGVATRALRLVARWALGELGVERLWLTTAPENIASQRVAEKAGFTREGVLRAHLVLQGRRRDSVVFSLLPGELA